MAVRLNPCDPRRLRLLAEDRLPVVELDGLEEHLQHCDDCRATLDELAGAGSWLDAVRHYLGPDPTGPFEPKAATVAVDDVLGALNPTDWPDSLGRLGAYEIKGVIGRGGMGVVLKAFDPSLSRNVAIKVLSPHLAGTGTARQRFLREARAGAAVVHEHVVSVFSVVESAPLPFLVMEYVPGGSLQDRLDRDGPLSLTEVLRIGMQTAAGLAAAHAQGLVHRDVKPANILLENGIERVKLTDFGLARAVADASMTQSGVVAGTPHYMAPEQARAEATDHRADLFSLGSTIYAMCTGLPPFRAETPYAVVRRVADDAPRPIREFNPEVPVWLEAIVERLHAKNPADRFDTASEVADLLGRCLAHVQQPNVEDLPSGLIPRTSKAKRRSRWIAALLFLTVPLALGGAFAYRVWWVPRDVRPDRPAAVAVSVNDEEMLQQAHDLAGKIEADLHRISEPTDHVSAKVRELSERASALGRELAPDRPARSPALSRQNEGR